MSAPSLTTELGTSRELRVNHACPLPARLNESRRALMVRRGCWRMHPQISTDQKVEQPNLLGQSQEPSNQVSNYDCHQRRMPRDVDGRRCAAQTYKILAGRIATWLRDEEAMRARSVPEQACCSGRSRARRDHRGMSGSLRCDADHDAIGMPALPAADRARVPAGRGGQPTRRGPVSRTRFILHM